MEYTTQSEQETKKLAVKFASQLEGGEVIYLSGGLGSGKTTFVRGVAESFGFLEPVRSPSFTIVNRYPVSRGRIKQIIHVDLYRIHDPAEIVPLALEEELGRPDTVAFIEWPDVVGAIPWKPHTSIRLQALSSGEHQIEIMPSKNRKPSSSSLKVGV